ncbi:g11593 [Coccomyxa elongata]
MPSLAASRSTSYHPAFLFKQHVACRQLANGISRRQQCRTGSISARRSLVVRAGDWNPPTVADTKRKFYEGFSRPIPGIYSNVIQELLVQHHIMRYNKSYSYDEVFGLGFVSVFDQVLEGLKDDDRTALFNAYIASLGEDGNQYRKDAEKVEALAKELSGPSDLKPQAEGGDLQKTLATIAERSKEGKFLYTKFFAIGLFRLLELTGAKDPKALEALVSSMNIPQEAVSRDLMTYKGVLSKLSAAKELMNEMYEREKKKAAEREAEKAAKTKKEAQTVDA